MSGNMRQTCYALEKKEETSNNKRQKRNDEKKEQKKIQIATNHHTKINV